MAINELGVFIDGENVNQFEIISEIFKNLDSRNFHSKTRKIIFSKLSNVDVDLLTEILKTNLLQIVVSYKRIVKTKQKKKDREQNKNNADFRFYIEVLDCLYQDNPDGFVFATGDKDYTELVLELKKRGKYLIGFGNENRASDKYISLFDEFIICEDLKKKSENKEVSPNVAKEKVSDNLKKVKEEQAKKEKENKRLEEARLREEKARIKEENRKKEKEKREQKIERDQKFIEIFKVYVDEFLKANQPNKYLLTTITSEIKKKHPEIFPEKYRVKYDIYVKLGVDIKNDTQDKSKAYLEILP